MERTKSQRARTGLHSMHVFRGRENTMSRGGREKEGYPRRELQLSSSHLCSTSAGTGGQNADSSTSSLLVQGIVFKASHFRWERYYEEQGERSMRGVWVLRFSQELTIRRYVYRRICVHVQEVCAQMYP